MNSRRATPYPVEGRRTPGLGLALVLALLLLASTTASAASYGDFLDPIGIIEFVAVSDEHGLFGRPTASVASLDFNSTDFDLQCSRCPEGQVAQDVLSMDLQATRPLTFPYGTAVGASFDYSLQSFDAAGGASVSFMGGVTVEILELNGRSVAPISGYVPLEYTFCCPPDSDRPGEAHVSGISIDIGITAGFALLDLSGLIYDAGRTGQPTRTRMRFETRVDARHEGISGQAVIRARDFWVADYSGLNLAGTPRFETRAVLPEPSAGMLTMLGLAWMSAWRIRAKADPNPAHEHRAA